MKYFEEKNLYEIYAATLKSIRYAAEKRKLKEILPALFVHDFEFPKDKTFFFVANERQYILPTSLTFHKQVAAYYIGDIYCIAPCFRKENKTFKRTEKEVRLEAFHQIEVEVAMDSLEDLLHYVIDFLRDIEKTFCEIAALPFTDTFSQYRIINFNNYESRSTDEFERLVEEITKNTEIVTVIIGTPRDFKPFINKAVMDFSGLSYGFDVILPSQYGEICSGGIRDKASTKNFVKYSDAEDRFEKVATGGFGLGLERLISFFLKNSRLTEVMAFHLRL